MPQFISKLQHNTYEKGEFSDERARTLEETVALIKTFPWDEERPLTDIQLTGPSVTIQNKDGEYLKVGLYFNGKFCLYFLDYGGHVYEYHAPDIIMVDNVVTDFFNGTMRLDDFDKHFFNMGSKNHFLTNDFTYTVSSTWFYLSSSGLLIFDALIIGIALIGLRQNFIFFFTFLLLALLLALSMYIVVQYHLKSKDIILRVSKGSDSFEFGKTTIETFYKKDINKIKIYQNNNAKSSGRFDIVEIYFKGDSYITFPGLLLSHWEIPNKFPGIKIEHIVNSLKVMNRMWAFTQ